MASPWQTALRLAVPGCPLAGCPLAEPAAVSPDGTHRNAVLLHCHAPTRRHASKSADVAEPMAWCCRWARQRSAWDYVSGCHTKETSHAP
jgi:hypothetical protein